MRHLIDFEDLVIPDGVADSNVISSKLGFGVATDLILFTDDVAVTVLIGPDEGMAIGDLVPLQVESGTDFTASASKGVVIPTTSFKSFAVQAASGVAGDKTYVLRGQAHAQ